MSRVMIIAVIFFFYASLISLTHGYRLYDYRDYVVDDPNVDYLPEIIHVQRRNDWCARWGDNCIPNTRVKFARCCDDLVCSCAFSGNKCQCKRPAVLGRR